jgi:hypothetical protein
MRSPPATSRLFHSIVVVGLGTAAGGCGSGSAAGADAASDASPGAQGFLRVGTGDAAPAPDNACCSRVVSCDGGDAGSDGDGGTDFCCVVEAGRDHPSCCSNYNFACVPQPTTAADGGDAGLLCGCWPLFV